MVACAHGMCPWHELSRCRALTIPYCDERVGFKCTFRTFNIAMLVHEKKCKQLITVRELVGLCARLLAPPRPLVTTCTAPTTSSSYLLVPFSQLDPNAHDNISKFVHMPQTFVEVVGTYIHTRTYSHAQAQAHTHEHEHHLRNTSEGVHEERPTRLHC